MTNLTKYLALAAVVATTFLAPAVSHAGSTRGPVRHTDTVDARGTDVYRVRLRGGELTRVVVVGDRVADLDLYIYDENGNLVAHDDDNTATCLATVTPKWTGEFTVKVVNRGNVDSDYVLAWD